MDRRSRLVAPRAHVTGIDPSNESFAIRESRGKMGTLAQVLEEAGFVMRKARIENPKYISVHRISLPVPLTQA